MSAVCTQSFIIQVDYLGAAVRQNLGHAVLREQNADLTVAYDVLQSFQGIGWVKRDVCAVSFPDAEEPRHCSRSSVRTDSHQTVRPTPSLRK